MPELPEVENTRLGIEPWVAGRRVREVLVREPRLRWPVTEALVTELPGHRIEGVQRRAKYLLLNASNGCLLLHLGMSGSLALVGPDVPARKHDHLDIVLEDGRALRLHDPRRFGAALWTGVDPWSHPLLAKLGPEPLGNEFGGDWLYARARGRRAAVKSFLMDSRVVVGVGNIYATESLFEAGIHPARRAGRVSRERYESLARAVRSVLSEAIVAGGTTLRDYVGADGAPGYFARALRLYGRAGEPCPQCGRAIRVRVIAQRSSFYCIHCQR